MPYARALLLTVLFLACAKEEDTGPTTVTGTWSYTTNDQKVMVTFDLEEQASGDLAISNLSFSLDGQVFNSAFQLEDVGLPTIGKLRFNINDAKAVYPYFIEFEDCTVSVDFNVINAIGGSYSYPWGTINTLDGVQILRVN